MNEALKEAAERIHRYAGEHELPPPDEPYDVVEDALALADAVLADAKAAELDETAVEEAWLRSIGFQVQGHIDDGIAILADMLTQEHTGWYQFLRIRLPIREAQLMQCQAGTNEAEGMSLPEDCCKTRGDVLRLLTALGINLKELP